VSAMTWDSFLDVYPRSHLVVAWLHGRHRTGEARRARFDLLARIATALEPRGDWAMTDANPREIYFAYANAADGAIMYFGRCQAPRPQHSMAVASGVQVPRRIPKVGHGFVEGRRPVLPQARDSASPKEGGQEEAPKSQENCPHDGRRHARNASRNGVLSKARSPCSARTSPQGIATQATQKTG
jgi:hypothetical protein